MLAVSLAACSTRDTSGGGLYHVVKPGENIYRIGLRYDVPTDSIIKANRIRDVHSIRVGTVLWIPAGGSKFDRSAAKRRTNARDVRRLARMEVRRESQLDFQWPVRGKVTSRFGRRGGRLHQGLDLAARKGTAIRAAESGKVIHSGRLGDYGKAVIVKHAGHYRTVYGHASKTLVRKGQFVEKGQKIALVGNTGRSSGSHLHFEIRRRQSARDPMLYLPRR